MKTSTRLIDVQQRPATSIWPSPAQGELLRAALWPGAAAVSAWRRWRTLQDPRTLDISSWQLLPLVAHNLGTGFTDELLDECRGFHRYHWARNQQLLHQAGKWIAEWQALGVPVIVLKGLALAAETYPEPGLRPMADVDLLVPEAHAGTVAARLQAAGWRPHHDYLAWEDVSLDTLQSFNWSRGSERLDLHWHVLHRCTRPEITELFWSRARPLALPGVTTRQLAAEDTLLHVCSHGVQYAWQPPFRWLADAAWILRRAGGDLDWARVQLLAERSGSAVALRHGLEYAAAELQLPIPAATLAALRQRRTGWRERWDYRRTTEPAEGNRWIRALNLGGMLWRAGGRGAPWTQIRRMRRFLCARWESPNLRGVLRLAWRKAWTGHRGTVKRSVHPA